MLRLAIDALRFRTALWVTCLLLSLAGSAHATAQPADTVPSRLSTRSNLELFDILAQTAPDPAGGGLACFPVDIVFVIDQSTSMSEYAGAAANDPFGNRKSAVVQAFNQLIANGLDLCNGITYRVAVVSFGTDAEINLELTTIGPFMQGERDQARALYEQLQESVPLTVMGQTDPAEAFQLAAGILAEAGSEAGERRKRAIVFITDGEPCVDGEFGVCGSDFSFGAYAADMRDWFNEFLPFDPTLLGFENCLNALRAQQSEEQGELPADGVRECFAQYQVGDFAYRSSTYVWMMLLRDGNRPFPESLRTILQDIVDNRGGSLTTLAQQDIPSAFRDIVSRLTGVRATRLSCGTFAMNPYLRLARLHFFKLDPTLSVEISYVDVNGTRHSLEGGATTTDGFGEEGEGYIFDPIGATETYIINSPYPGLWELSADNCEGLDAYFEPVEISAVSPDVLPLLAQYDRDPGYNPENPRFLHFSLRDAENPSAIILQADDNLFAINVHATARSTAPVPETGEHAVQEFEFAFNPGHTMEGPQFTSTTPIYTRYAGTYEVTFDVQSTYHEGEVTGVSSNKFEVFNTPYQLFQQTTGYEVLPVTPFQMEMLRPIQGEEFFPLHGAAGGVAPPEISGVPVRMRLVTRDGQSLESAVGLMFAGEITPNTAFAAVMEAGGMSTGPIGLTQVPGAPDEFAAEMPGLNATGPHTITVTMIDDATIQDFAIDDPEVEVAFTRSDETWRFGLLRPLDGETITPVHDALWTDGLHWPLRVHPLEIRVQLVDEDLRPYDNIEEVMTYAPQEIQATVRAGEAFGTATLRPDPVNPGQYTGEIPDLNVRGEYLLTLDLDLSYPNFTPESVATQITFQRADTLFTTSTTYFILLALLLLVILLEILLYLRNRNNKVIGELVFRDAGAEIAAFNLYSGKNWRDIKGRELKAHPSLGLKKIKVASLRRKRKSLKDSAGEFGGFGDEFPGFSDGPGVRVRLVTDEGEKMDVDLAPEAPLSYDGTSMFTMEYQPLATEKGY